MVETQAGKKHVCFSKFGNSRPDLVFYHTTNYARDELEAALLSGSGEFVYPDEYLLHELEGAATEVNASPIEMAQLVAGMEILAADLGHRAVTVEAVLFDKITIYGCFVNHQTKMGMIVQLKIDANVLFPCCKH